MKIKINKIIVKKKYRDFVSRPNTEQTKTIYDSLKESGQYEAIILNQSNVLIDGHTRLELLKKLGKDEIIYERRNFNNENEETTFMFEVNYNRRHLNLYQRSLMVLELLKVERKIAKERQIELGRTHGKDPSGKFYQKGRSVDIVAQRLNKTISPKTILFVDTIQKSATPQQLEDLQEGRRKISSVYNELLDAQKPKEDLPLPEGVHNVWYIDPPWRYSNKNTGGSMSSGAKRKYPTMSIDELKELGEKCKKIIPKNAICFMWAVTPLGKECQEVMESFGFEYKTKMYWIKKYPGKKRGMGYYFAGEVEELLIGIKGKVKPFRLRLENYLEAAIGEHSEKPEEFRQRIEMAARVSFNNPKFFEMFSRADKEIPNWTVWGFDAVKKNLGIKTKSGRKKSKDEDEPKRESKKKSKVVK